MKNLFLGLVAMTSAVVFTSCEEGFLTISLDKEQTVAGFTIVAGTVGEYSYNESSSAINIDSILTANDVSPDQLESVFIKSATIEVGSSNTTDNFSQMSNISLSLTPANSDELKLIENGDPGDGTVYSVPSDALEGIGDVLVLTENPFDFDISIMIDSEIQEDMPMLVKMVFDIKAKAVDTE